MIHQTELVRAILNRPQQKAFQEQFNINPNNLTPIVTGYWKYVLLGEDKAYLFHRNHEFAELAANEKYIYQWLNKLDKLEAPLLIENITNKEISPYEILVVKRLQGVLLYEVMDDMDLSNLRKTCLQLSSHIAYWHNADTKDLPAYYQTTKAVDTQADINQDTWLYKLLEKDSFSGSLDYIIENLVKYFPDLNKSTLKNKLEKKLKPLLTLAPVIVHQDLHEAQILVSKEAPHNITGILDWESARLLNPIIEFNFNEWWKPYWIKNINELQKIRLDMWKQYIKDRNLKTNIEAKSILTLYNLYYSLHIDDWENKENNKDIFNNASKYVLKELQSII